MNKYRISRFKTFNESRMQVFTVDGTINGEPTSVDVLAGDEQSAMELAMEDHGLTEVFGVVGKSELDSPMDESKVNEGENRHQNYMFFQNLNTIKHVITNLEKLNQEEVDRLISDGHDCVSDHMSTSKDDIEEVCQFLCSRLSDKNQETDITSSTPRHTN